MRLAGVFSHDVLEGIRRIRANAVLAYGTAVGWVAAATLLRFVIEGELPDTVPFTTYSLALIIASVLGGFWPGMVALGLAAVGGWFFLLAPVFSFTLQPNDVWALILFVIVGTVNISVLSSLVAAVLAHDEHQQFLKRELQHRSRNLFAVVQAIASRSFGEGQTLSETKDAFNARLAALARTHAVLENSAWAGAPLREIVLQELLGFATQTTITGCDIALNTPAAQHFALIVHELTTNAIKHGALSTPEGRIKIEGRLERANGKGAFRFLWNESGGPPVDPPTRKGFGSAILFGTAKHFARHVEAKYAPEGLTYDLAVDQTKIEEGAQIPPAPNARGESHPS